MTDDTTDSSASPDGDAASADADSDAEQSTEKAEYKTVAGVSFRGTESGSLDESAIDSDDFASHYLIDGDTKSESSFPVVDASGLLRSGNVADAWDLRGHADDKSALASKLMTLNEEWPEGERPIDAESEDDDDKEKADTDGYQYREKHAAFKAADPQRRVAWGPVLVSSELDTHGDFFRPDTVRDLADGFMADVADPDAEPGGPIDLDESGVGGLLHSIFPPQDHMALVENSVLDEDTVIGSGPSAQEFPEGTWVQGWKIHDEELWDLVAGGENVLGGFSIGMWVDDSKEYDPGDLPDDVTVPEAVSKTLAKDDLSIEDVYTGEITSGSVHEVSLVDAPAVPRAQILSHKSQEHDSWTTSADADALRESHAAEPSFAMAKAAGALTESYESCVDYLVDERGHSPEQAEALAEYLQRVVDDEDTATKSDRGGLFGRAKSLLSGDSASSSAESAAPVSVGTPAVAEQEVTMAGRTLSARNERRMKAIHDLTLSVLRDAGVDGGRMPFADDPEDGFDIDTGAAVDGGSDSDSDKDLDSDSEAGERTTETTTDAERADTAEDSQAPTGAAAEADSPRDSPADDTFTMTDDIEERFESLDDKIDEKFDELTEMMADDEADDEADEEKRLSADEVAEKAAETVLDRLDERQAEQEADSDDEPTVEDLQKAIGQIAENQQQLNDSIASVRDSVSAIAQADGVSQQEAQAVERAALDGAGDGTGDGDDEPSTKAKFLGLGD